MRARHLLLGLAGLLLAQAARAGFPPVQFQVRRTYENPVRQFRRRLTLLPYQGGVIQLTLTLRLPQEAPLRPGEQERFQVFVQSLNEGPGASTPLALLTVRALEKVHAYRRVSGQLVLPSPVVSARVDLRHEGRIRVAPPPVFEEVAVHHLGVQDPVTLVFQDQAAPPTGSAEETSYAFSIHRWAPSGGEHLVAAGELDRQPVDVQEVLLEDGGAYTGDAVEWFRPGADYLVRLRVRRRGTPWYSDSFGPAQLGAFRWGEGGVAGLRPVTPEGRRFRRLHRALP